MTTKLTLTIDFGDDKQGALRAYAHFIGVSEHELVNTFPGSSFSGAAVPNLSTLLRPAHVRVDDE